MKQLFHMSRTAGVGMADYAAVNPFAVGAIVLGLASAFTLIFREPFLLVLPLLALLLGVFAFVQIRSSSGTQTGTLLAFGGILLSLCFGGLVVVDHFREQSAVEQHKQTLAKLVSDFGNDLITGDFEKAYEKFDSPFHDRVKMDVFKARMSQVQDGRFYLAKPTKASLEPRVAVERDESTGQYTAIGLMKIDFEKPEGSDTEMMILENIVFRLVKGEWKVEDLPAYFERQVQSPRGMGR